MTQHAQNIVSAILESDGQPVARTFVVSTSINDGEYECHAYIEAESVEEIPGKNAVLVNGSIKVTFGDPIVRIGFE